MAMSAGSAPEPAVSDHTPVDFSLDRAGTTFIEASAGTGKTHALTTLVARLVIEEGWPIDRILVVTFTRAATTELRDRIRRVLGMLLDAVRARLREAAPPAGRIRDRSTSLRRNSAANSLDSGLRGNDEQALAPSFPRRRESTGSNPDTDAAGREPPAGSPDREAVEPAIDPRARELLAAWEDRAGDIDFALAARRLEGAMHDIDRANVFTIHGFCQRVLADLAFESGLSFECEVGGEGGEAVAAAVRDFWRRRMYPSSPLLMRHAVENGFLPRALAGWTSRRRAKIGAEVVGGDPPAQPLDACEATWRGVYDAVRSQWESRRDTFRTEILDGPWLNRQRYRPARSKADLAALDALFSAVEPRLPAEDAAGRYGREQLSRACKRGFAVPDHPLFDALDRLEDASAALRAVYDQWLRWARREALAEVRQSVRRRVRTDRILAWDDLPIELDHALGSAGGERLAERIRREFPCALIDEYQDTDPVQARIFSRIYADPARSPQAAATFEPENEGASARGGRARPGPFIVVGDPKQSIYRFRGADVFAYLAARRSATGRLHLDRNWRSVPPLVEAVNAVFSGAAAFVTTGIGYRAVAAAGEPPGPLRLTNQGAPVPLEFRLLSRVEDGKALAKKDVLPVVAGAAADEIARLLELAGRGEAVVEDRPLAGADLAVLVRTRGQGRLMAGALRERGVRSVEIDDGSVFHTREAEQLERLLWALADPGREPRVRGALAGDLLGLDARALHALGDDEQAWGAWAQRREDWRSHWTSRGIGSVLLRLLEGEGGAKHLLRHSDGARRLTNYRHLAELAQAAETRDRLAASELAAWLNRRRADPDSRDEEAKLRIDSDERLVRILTVHGSKGLEFPVVFCPFAWDARGPGRRSDAVDAVHHRGAEDGYREVIDLAPDGRAAAIEWLEEFAESVRLFYVALTRAKYRCVVTWGQVRGAEDAPLAWLLHRSADGQPPTAEPDGDDAAVAALRAVADRFRGLGAEAWRGEVEAFARRLPGAVTVSILDPEPPPARPPERLDDPPPALAVRELRRPLRRIRSLTSFSALWAEAAPADGGAGDRATAGRDGAGIDRPDHDQHEAPADAAGDPSGADGAVAGERTAFTFPRGPVAGSCLHRIFERLDDPPEFAVDRTGLDEICAAALADFGIDGVWQPVARDMVESTRAVLLRTPEAVKGAAKGSEGGAGSGRDVITAGYRVADQSLAWSTGTESGRGVVAAESRTANQSSAWSRGAGSERDGVTADCEAGRAAGNGGFRLGDPNRRLVELEFHFPVEGLDHARLSAALVEHGYPDPFPRAVRNGTGGAAPPLDGFLRGYIDLVVAHGQRWYVVDYKSNWLGPEPGDYAPEALAASMRAGGYTLQYLIYLVALHRYLATRHPDYDCERHVGGAFYLFVRGIDPAAGMRRGVYFDRPAAECLLALDDCFRGGGA